MKRDPVQKEIDDAIELFESSFYVVPEHDSERGYTSYNVSSAPAFRSIRRLKARRADYRPGPVKVYTTEEIRDYVESQELRTRD